jgi:DNA-binding response OmpR family regulator
VKTTPLILIIEDEEDILELEEFHLQKAGYETMGFLSTKGVEQALEEEPVCVMVVDRNLPGVEGSEFVSHLRDLGWDQPVMFVSAKDQDEQVLEGFNRGGDDYLKKPFNMNELVHRVKALLKRSGCFTEVTLKHRDIAIDAQARKAYCRDRLLDLSRLEFDLLSYLMHNANRVISREELLDEVWEKEEQNTSKSVNVAINRLKKKLPCPNMDTLIEPVRGIGYRLC